MAGCTSHPVVESPAETPAPAPAPVQEEANESHIDLDAIERSLGLSGDSTELGYREKAFNTCSMGYGFSSSRNCRTQVMAVIRFRISCRESEGTESDVDYQQAPIHSAALKWSLGNQKGRTATDTEGYGVIRGLFPNSSKSSRLKLIHGNNNLTMRAQDMNRIVAPKSFCSSN